MYDFNEVINDILSYKPTEKLSLIDSNTIEPVQVFYIIIDNGSLLNDFGYGKGIYGFKEKNNYIHNEIKYYHNKLYKVAVSCKFNEVLDLCHTNDELILSIIEDRLLKEGSIKNLVQNDNKYKLYRLNIMIPSRRIKGLYDYVGEAYFLKNVNYLKKIVSI